MFVYCANDPVDHFDNTGASWSSVWERIKNTVRGVLHGVNTILVSAGFDTPALAGKLLCMTKDKSGIYHANFDCWQQYFGYNDLYDFMFDIGTSMKSKKFQFSYNSEKYILWAWKGDYVNLGAGAELGIYYGGGSHWKVDTSLAMKMSLTLKYKGKTIISYTSTTWWITGFNPKYINVSASQLTATYTIWFNSRGMFAAFRNTNPKGWIFNSRNLSATYTF